ncbi:MAG: hypothetical protein HYU81_01715 [Candidatus Brennerbacteria bacterium]|nr:hypothetical protein [Candidatus Brennerbacteria bacterium]
MKSSSRPTLAAALIFSIASSGIVWPAPVARAACTSWELVWTATPPELEILNPGDRIEPPYYGGLNPVTAESSPAAPNLPTGSEGEWRCIKQAAEPPDSSRTEEEKARPVGMELCDRAAKLAARLGGLTAFNLDIKAQIQTEALNRIKDYMGEQFKDATGVNLNLNDLKKTAFDAAGKFASDFGKDLWDNSGLKKEIDDKIKAIEKAGIEKLKELGGKAAEKALDTAKGILSTEVPITDPEGNRQREELKDKQDRLITEQKIAELNADTRQKCAELLKTTNESIKRALLYQLSTQVVEWIQTGKTPQFVKQPGVFLEESGRLALDRFISRTAPRLCQSFRTKIQLEIPSVAKRDNPFYEEITCSLDRVVKNADNFYQDFRKGGWIAYSESLKPKNNYFGASLMAQDQALEEAARAKEEAARDIAAGRGYRSQRQCVEWAKYELKRTPDPFMLSDTLSVGSTFYARTETRTGTTKEGTPPGAEGYTNTKGDQKFWAADGLSFWQCERDEITNPGTVAAGLSEKVAQSDFESLANADDASVLLQTIEDAIVNKLAKSGVKGLKSLLPKVFE